MKLSKKCEYALRALVYLAFHLDHENSVIQMSRISESEKMPVKFLESIMVTLKKRGILTSVRGTTGGYRLAKRPGEITLGEIVRIIDGGDPIGHSVAGGLTESDNATISVIEQIVEEANKAASAVYDHVSIEEMTQRIVRHGQENLIYHI